MLKIYATLKVKIKSIYLIYINLYNTFLHFCNKILSYFLYKVI